MSLALRKETRHILYLVQYPIRDKYNGVSAVLEHGIGPIMAETSRPRLFTPKQLHPKYLFTHRHAWDISGASPATYRALSITKACRSQTFRRRTRRTSYSDLVSGNVFHQAGPSKACRSLKVSVPTQRQLAAIGRLLQLRTPLVMSLAF